MIKFRNIIQNSPFLNFKTEYDEAIKANQKNIEAISISSYNPDIGEVDSRYVNLKIIDKDNFIFFTNYNSPKANAFKKHDQISAVIFWSSTNTQIRIKAKINRTSQNYNKEYFKTRSLEKNALAISSRQSELISNYYEVIDNFNEAKERNDLTECPEYWGGFSFVPYAIEFWKGDKFRLNRRTLYTKKDSKWIHQILQP